MKSLISLFAFFVTATAAGQPDPLEPVTIEDGYYQANPHSRRCDQSLKATYVDGKLISVDIAFMGTCTGKGIVMSCKDDRSCSGTSRGIEMSLWIMTERSYMFTGEGSMDQMYKERWPR